MADALVIDGVHKSFGSQRAVAGVSLAIPSGEIFSLLGPSGCGKTTLLRMIAGFERPDRGAIYLDGRDITGLPPERRPVNTVFQNYALFPHMTVERNIAFGLRMARRGAAEIRAKVERMLSLVRLTEFAQKSPAHLSGGQRQRVALARALVNEPRVLLLDEPLAALDLKLRQHMLAELTALHREVGATFVYVTHDQSEALSVSQGIAVMNEGRVEQVAAPEALYHRPATAFVASFIGDANFLEGRISNRRAAGEYEVMVEGLGKVGASGAEGHAPGEVVRIMVRPERLTFSQTETSNFPARIEDVSFLGPHTLLKLRCAGLELLCNAGATSGATGALRGEEGWLHIPAAHARVMSS